MTPSKLIVGPIDGGQVTNREAFNIDNDTFPILLNAYQWRGRVKRKRGTEFLVRLTRYFNSNLTAYSNIASFALSGGGGNLFTGFNLDEAGNVVPGSVSIVVAGNTYTDVAMDGVLTGAPAGSGTINYATGDITITGGGANTVSGIFIYYPGLPVLGLEDFKNNDTAFPGKVAFDTTFSYVITTTRIPLVYSVSFYKNLPTGTYPAYVQKTVTNPTQTTWNGETYQQFWSVNHQGAMWVTNGIDVPFVGNHIGMQLARAADLIYNSNTATTIDVTIAGNVLVIGDFVFFNEWTGTNAGTLNFQTGYVTNVVGNNVTITIPTATLGAGPYVPGIIQYLTNRSDPTVDCIRWYDGDPTNGNPTSPTFVTGLGWVNFMPPISFLNFSIANLPPRQYYLVGCRMIIPFKDRLLFIGAVVQASTGQSIYLQDTVVYSQNGTAYYTASFPASSASSVSLPTTVFTPLLVPENQTATPSAYFEDQTGFGGFVSAGVDKPAITVASNEDVLMIGFDPDLQTKLIYSGNDLVPFNFYLINSEYGSSSTFSSINLDKGVFTLGNRGIVISSQDQCSRIDLEIPDQIFQLNLLNNGNERVTAQRDYINEWIYFTYLSNELSQGDESQIVFPNQTLFYNYRDSSWGIFNECYTHYGQYAVSESLTWATVGRVYPTWKKWNDPWDSGITTAAQPDVIAGNQQGFVLKRDVGTGEGTSLSIQSFAGSLVTSLNHGLNEGDFIVISGAIGAIASQVNGKVFKVDPPESVHTFTLNPAIDGDAYVGGGLITRLYNPFIQTKQFPLSWGMGRKTRIGVQRYLFTTTSESEVSLYIYLSQDNSNPYNAPPIYPDTNALNSGLIYTTTVFTCPESTNLGLTPAKKNLMTPTAVTQAQIWHRLNTSLIGDTFQLAITMSEEQMREVDEDGESVNATAEIEFHGCIIDVTPSQMLI